MKNAIEFCIEYDLTPEELIAFNLVERNNPKACDKYIEKYGHPTKKTLLSLYSKGLIILSSFDNPNVVSSIVSSVIKEQAKDSLEDMGEELWQAYPAAFPLGDGMFIARKGPDKQSVLEFYINKINGDRTKHEFVLRQLKTYIKLVRDRKINGHRIIDWISNEMWDIIAEIEPDKTTGQFKTDI